MWLLKYRCNKFIHLLILQNQLNKKITYNEFESTEQIYTYIIYDYDGDTCIIEGNSNNNNLLIGNLDYDVYINYTKLENKIDGIYYNIQNSMNYGENIIQVKYENEYIQLLKVNYYPKIKIIIDDRFIIPGLNDLMFQVFSLDNSIIDFLKIKKKNLTDGLIESINIVKCEMNLNNKTIINFRWRFFKIFIRYFFFFIHWSMFKWTWFRKYTNYW